MFGCQSSQKKSALAGMPRRWFIPRFGALVLLALLLAAGMRTALADPAVTEQPAQPQTAQAAAPQAAAPEDTSNQIQEVVVTARLRKESLMQTPVVVTAVTAQSLDQHGITNFTQLESLVPNVDVSLGFNSDAIHVRGVGTPPNTNAGFEQQVGLFIDGAYMPNGHWLNDAFVDLDQLNVLEGPQGVYLGKNTIGGALQLTTKNPSDHIEGYIKGGYEFNAQERYTEGAVSIPITDTLGIRIATKFDSQEGWMTNQVTGGHGPDFRDNFGRVTLVWKPTDDFDATLKYGVGYYRDTGPGYIDILLGCAGPNNTASRTTTINAFYGPNTGSAECRRNYNTSYGETDAEDGRHDYTTIASHQAVGILHWRQNFGELTSISSFQGFAYHMLYEAGCCTRPDGTGMVPALDGTANSAYAEELRYQTKLDWPVNFLGGLYYERTAFRSNNTFSLGPAALNGFNGVTFTGPQEWSVSKHDSGPATSRAVFGEIQYKPIDEIELDASVRYSADHQDFSDSDSQASTFFTVVAPTFQPAGQGVQDSQSSYNISPQFTATYRPSSDFMTYLAFKTGYLSGGYSRTGGQNFGASGESYRFGPEKVKGGEIGTKFYAFDRSVQVNASAYYYDYTALQVNNYNPTTTSFTVQNAGEAVDKGIEVNGLWKMGGGFTLSGNVAYNKSFYVDFVGACITTAYSIATGCNVPTSTPGVYQQNFTGTHTDYAPDWAGRIQLAYTREFEDDWTLHTSVGMNFSDKYLISQYPAQPGFLKFDANVTVDHGPFSVSVIGQNLSNQFVCSTALGSTLRAPTEIACYADRAWAATVEATYRFEAEPEVSPAPAPAPMAAAPPPAPEAPPAPAPEAQRAFQVFFDFDKSAITDAAASVIQQAAASVKAGNHTRIMVTGHTDTVGSVRYNQKLSERRAAAVKAQLITDGVSGEEITTRGVGKTDLLVPTPDGVREPQNRRAEIVSQ